jgi:predicted protein tyrosine phosphatase
MRSLETAAYMMKMNPYQGEARKVLFVCSGGILRSPTCARVTASEYGWNTRSAGMYEEAIPHVSENLLIWADKVYALERVHANWLSARWKKKYDDKIEVLGIPDNYQYMDPELVKAIHIKLDHLKDPVDPEIAEII